MTSQINLSAVIIANIMGLTMLICFFISNFWISKLKVKGNNLLIIMFIVSGISCIADPICVLADGKPGIENYLLIICCNTWLYIGHIIISVCWVFLVVKYLDFRLSKIHKNIIFVLSSVTITFVIINIFVPIIFSIDENNVYSRTDNNWIYYVSQLFFIFDGLAIYLYSKRKYGSIKFFPVWEFIIPAMIGMGIQKFIYGVSTITPFTIISLACLSSCFQSELLFTDKLTSLYNRYYLSVLENRIKKYKLDCTIMMIDINRFKYINDTYGHNIGDQAIMELSKLLRSVVNIQGEVLRYAGDEFILVLNMQEKSKVEKIISKIYEELNNFNLYSGNPYKLSIAIGYSEINLTKHSMDELLDITDKLMYKNKQEYYKNNN